MYNKQVWGLLILKSRGDLSQKEFSVRSGLSRNTIALMEAGKYKHTPTVDTILKICSASTTVSRVELMEASGRRSHEVNQDDFEYFTDGLKHMLEKHELKHFNRETADWLISAIDGVMTSAEKLCLIMDSVNKIGTDK